MNQKGQEFTAFRFVIAAIMAVAVLSIVNTILTSYSNIGTDVTYEAIKDGIEGVVKSKGVQTIALRNLLFSGGMTLGKDTLIRQSGLDPEKLVLACDEETFVCGQDDCGDVDGCTARHRLNVDVFMCKDNVDGKYYVEINAQDKCT